jgi:hypothetical protein
MTGRIREQTGGQGARAQFNNDGWNGQCSLFLSAYLVYTSLDFMDGHGA